MSQPPNEAPRDQEESAFTPILRKMRDRIPSVMAAVFVDTEGECIDYVSQLDPYEAKVCAAHMLIMIHMLRGSREKVGFGEPILLEIAASDRDLWVHRVGEDYVIVLILEPGYDRVLLRSAIALAATEFLREVGLEAPSWEGGGKRLSVRVRPSPGWQYAPETYTSEGVRVVISDVLGRWVEPGGIGGDDVVCFRVRTAEGQELTLLHDPDRDGWIVRD